MVVFGVVSSVFDYATFALLLFWLKAGTTEFRTGWFVESVVSASLIVLVVRTSQPFFRNRPGKWLMLSTIAMVLITLAMLLTPLAGLFGFIRLPIQRYAAMGAIVIVYMMTAETAKRLFYRHSTL